MWDLVGTLGERDHLENLEGKVRIILKWIIKKFLECVCVWTDVAHNTDKWWVVLNREMKLVKNY